MVNAGEELLDGLFNIKSAVKCAYIYHDDIIVLREGYSEEDWERFIDELDFEYDDSCDSDDSNDFVDGNVWFEDGSWLERECMDDHIWWIHHKCPDIPKECKNGNNDFVVNTFTGCKKLFDYDLVYYEYKDASPIIAFCKGDDCCVGYWDVRGNRSVGINMKLEGYSFKRKATDDEIAEMEYNMDKYGCCPKFEEVLE